MALLAHILGFLLSVIGPLVIWLIKKDESAFVDDQGKEALNFQITMLIGYVVSGALTMAVIGCVLLPIVLLVDLIFSIMAALEANKGVRYRYPFALRLIT
jgi:uncharacterized Tic20 family protein